jgi:type IX secretion system PorP/SprF family membrane protein
MKRILLFTIQLLFLVQVQSLFAQDPHYSMYIETPVNVNPALCGVAYDVRVIANYRSQWQSVSTPYKTYGATGEFAIKHQKTHKAYLTTGLNIYQDVAGTGNFSQLHIGAILGVVVSTGANSKLSFAATGSFDQRRVTTGGFQWENQYNGYQYDPSIQGENIPATQVNYADFGAGVNYHFSKSTQYISSNDGHRFDIGFAVYHVNTPLVSFYNSGETQYMKYSGNMSFAIALPQAKANIIPSVLFLAQGPSIEVNAGIMFRYIISEASKRSTTVKPMAISAGAYYRSTDSFVPQILFEWDKYAVGASYDLNVSKLTPYSNLRGGLEIVLRYAWNPGYGKSVGLNNNPQSTPYFK